MPPEPKIKRSNRKEIFEPRYDGGQARELEEKRNRGEISCAECRRLKIKCDRRVPCQSCQKRGCVALCPNGSFTTSQDTRFVLAATEHLHLRIAGLNRRIHKLEAALASLQAEHSSEPHPLLREGVDADHTQPEDAQNTPQGSPDVIDAFGTLSISADGVSRFYGPTGGPEANLDAPDRFTNNSSSSSTNIYRYPPLSTPSPPTETRLVPALFSHSFPFTPLGTPVAVQDLIESYLPPQAVARELVDTYLTHVLWLFHGVSSAQLSDMLSNYQRQELRCNMGAGENVFPGGVHTSLSVNVGEEYSGPHGLALLFIVFAIGAIMRPMDGSNSPLDSYLKNELLTNSDAEMTQPYSSFDLGEHFHQLSCAALALQPVLEKPALATIQTLYLMGMYNVKGGSAVRSEAPLEMTWGLTTLAAHLAQTLTRSILYGIDRDGARWGLSPKIVQRRRTLFWDVYLMDTWQSLSTGRPPTLALAYLDCGFPDPHDEEGVGADGSAFCIWQYRFASECITEVIAHTLTAEAPSYATIMELDRKIRDFPLLDDMCSGGSAKSRKSNKCEAQREAEMCESLEGFVMGHVKESVLLYIHRSFFAQAIIEHPEDPFQSEYTPSFLASCRASTTILRSVREHFNVWPSSCTLFWPMWSFAFSAAVVFGTIVTRGPRSPLAQSAMVELEQACTLFSNASAYSARAKKALPILLRLAAKARYAQASAEAETSISPEAGGALWSLEITKQQGTEDDELAIFAGHTRFVSAKKLPTTTVGSTPLLPSTVTAYSAPTQPQQRYSTHAVAVSDGSDLELPTVSLERNMAFTLPPPCPTAHSERKHQGDAVVYATDNWNGGRAVRQQFHHQSAPNHGAEYTSGTAPREAQYYVPQHGVPSQSQPYYNPYVQDHQRLYPPDAYFAGQQQQPLSQADMYQPNSELVNLGLAARDSRLDERWSAFVQDSGLLEGVNLPAYQLQG
ncbi:hypothetical protein FPV67DRAFT_1501416 [Lyophyllum atratum]|nr:hypothetical protein FPV67DRAFT_1501416 [Lyophyllum atratum]